MNSLGIYKGEDLYKNDESFLIKHFGKAGKYYHNIAHGHDNRPVQPDRTRKSFGAERTFEKDLKDKNVMLEKLKETVKRVSERMIKSDVKGRTVTLKIKYFDFTIRNRSKTLTRYMNSYNDILPVMTGLFHTPSPPDKPVRLLGLTLSNLDTEKKETESAQLSFEFY